MTHEHYQYFRVPARLLRDELLDRGDAHMALHGSAGNEHLVNLGATSWSPDPELPTRPWGEEGQCDHEVEVGVEWTIEDYTHNGSLGGFRLSRAGEPWTWLAQDHDQFRLSQSRAETEEHQYWSTYDGDVSGVISRTAVEDYCRAIPGWPAGLDASAIFALYTDEIIALGPQEWAGQMDLEGWDWTTERPTLGLV